MQRASAATGVGRWSVIALGLAMPISVAIDNVLLLFVLVAWLVAGNYRETLAVIRGNPVAQAALVLFGLIVIGLSYGSRDSGEGLRHVSKYIDLLFIPILMSFFRDAKTRERALIAFSLAAVASVIASHIAAITMLSQTVWLPGEITYPRGFKNSITHNLIVGFSAFLFAVLARESKSKKMRIAFVALALLAAHNVIFMVIGRTGYLAITVLFLYFFIVTFGRRGALMMVAIGMATFATAYTSSTAFQGRMDDAVREFAEWRLDKPAATSVGFRLEWYMVSIKLVGENPLIGSGIGSFRSAYARAVEGEGRVATDNPHNEYLMMAVQLGLFGLAALVYLFYRQWQAGGRLEQSLYRDLARGVVLMFAVGCLFNSLLLDHTEGRMFAWLSALLFAAPMRPNPSTANPVA